MAETLCMYKNSSLSSMACSSSRPVASDRVTKPHSQVRKKSEARREEWEKKEQGIKEKWPKKMKSWRQRE